jgi:hypothetical protein
MRAFCYLTLVLIAGLIFAAFFFGIFTMTAEREDAAYRISLVIHTDSVKAATESAEEKAKELTGTLSTTRHVSKIDENGASFTVATTDNREMVFQADENSMIRGTALQGIHVGDRATVNYKTKDGKNLAQKIKLEAASN